MKLFPSLRLAAVALMAAVLVGCATQQPPVSGEDYVQSARAQVGAVYQTIGDLKAQGVMNQAQTLSAIAKAEALEKQANDAAALVRAGDTVAGQAKARAAISALLLLKSELPKGKP